LLKVPAQATQGDEPMTWKYAFALASILTAVGCGGTSRRGTENVVLQKSFDACPQTAPCPDAGLCREVFLPAGHQRLCVPAEVCTGTTCEAQIGATSCTLTETTVSCPVGPL
jgi:hypothetical protein